MCDEVSVNQERKKRSGIVVGRKQVILEGISQRVLNKSSTVRYSFTYSEWASQII